MNDITKWVLVAVIPYIESADLDEWLKLIYRNFDKCIKLLIAVYGKCCVICGDNSPVFRSDSGTTEHYWTRHRRSTALFVLNDLFSKSPDEIEEMINHG